jgi:DNA-damage-inducible protein J
MNKTANLNLRVEPKVKKEAETILSALGVPMSVAIDLYLKQIVYTGSIPFKISLPQAKPLNINDLTPEQFDAELTKGYEDYKAGRLHSAEAAFAKMKKDLHI